MSRRFTSVLGGVLGAFILWSCSSIKPPSLGFASHGFARSGHRAGIGTSIAISSLRAGQHDRRTVLLGREAGNGMRYGLIMPAPASFPGEVYEAAKRERDDLVAALDEGDLVFEEELQELPRASMLAHMLSQIHDVDVIACVHPIEYTPLSEEAESTALGRQFFRVRESLKATARATNVPMLMHPAVCDSKFLEVMKGSSYFKDVTKATVDDAELLAAVRRQVKQK
eukprot:gb/GFBE01014150.1/.p1 GENE.gb/GFBE01014150.1/~~gb/GFBE01014150.1/.p1  ORF type:complete len:226 (+),score=49.21 gb/GFBE01014150.1/:1-678(+)